MRLPRDAREGYHKDLEGYTLVFEFDEEGEARGAARARRRDPGADPVASGTEDEEDGERAPARGVLRSGSGDLREAICEKAVTFEQGDVRATSEKGTFRNVDSKLVLEDEPRLWEQKASLEATIIEIDVASGDVDGDGERALDVDGLRGVGGAPFPSESHDPVYFVSEKVRYDRAADTAVYTGEARGIQGPNRIEAGHIRLLQGAGELRRGELP